MARRRVVRTLDEAVKAAREIALPGVLKPSTGVSSLYTVRFDSIEELADRFTEFSGLLSQRLPAALRYMSGRWLVEEYVAGPGYSVESVVAVGTVRHVAVCEKGPMAEPFFREVGHSAPARLTPAARDELADLTERAIHAMGIDGCVTHTEFKGSADGPRLLEVGGRVGGGSIRQVVAHSTGVDLVDLVLRLAMGDTPDVAPACLGAAASRSLFPPLPGTVARLELDQLASRPGVVAVNYWLGEGDVYRTPPDGYGEVLGVVATAATADGAIELADAAISSAGSTVEMVP
jgi:biotin carboxylase